MDTVQITSVTSITGQVVGTSANPARNSLIAAKATQSYTQSGTAGTKMTKVLDHCTDGGGVALTIAISTISTIDLSAGQVDPLGDTFGFTKVKEFYVEHDSASLATAGIKVFAASASAFQGPLVAASMGVTAGYFTLLPGESAYLRSPTSGGWTVDGSHKNLAIENLDGTALHVATVKLFVGGE